MFSDGQVISENIMSIRIATGQMISANFKEYNVQNLIVHEGYDPMTFENDIALMKIKESFDFNKNFRSICYSQLSSLPEAVIGTAIGYGSTDQSAQHSHELRKVEMPIVEKEECYNSDIEFFSTHIFEGNFCAGEINVHKGVCSGDSG